MSKKGLIGKNDRARQCEWPGRQHQKFSVYVFFCPSRLHVCSLCFLSNVKEQNGMHIRLGSYGQGFGILAAMAAKLPDKKYFGRQFIPGEREKTEADLHLAQTNWTYR